MHGKTVVGSELPLLSECFDKGAQRSLRYLPVVCIPGGLMQPDQSLGGDGVVSQNLLFNLEMAYTVRLVFDIEETTGFLVKEPAYHYLGNSNRPFEIALRSGVAVRLDQCS